jgi:2-oxoglutarate dehydrogenase E2 component (dihydrolipoamide succinyltransferase)
MGESVAEGTIVRWIKQVGETVGKDEPLFEISTDKVDAEIPSPAEGVLREIRVKEGDTVPVHTVVAVIDGPDGARDLGADGALDLQVQAEERGREVQQVAPPQQVGPEIAHQVGRARAVLPIRTSDAAGDVRARGAQDLAIGPRGLSPESRIRSLSSPVVRNIARAHGIDVRDLQGTGINGRVTKRDILRVVAGGGAAARVPSDVSPAPVASQPGRSIARPAENVRIEKMSVMRRKIAEHMVASVRTSPHVYSTYEVDFARIDALRQAHRVEYESRGARLTYTAFIAKATAHTLREYPLTNASLDADHNIIYRNDVNLGVAVALEQGLIVPVIRKADERSLFELCQAVQDLATRARSKQLKVEEVEGGTFTITNPGIFGGLWGLPIISQPQVAILAVGSIDKRAVVVDDQIVIRPMSYLTLGYDHRLIDGADGGRFLQALKRRLEQFGDEWMG